MEGDLEEISHGLGRPVPPRKVKCMKSLLEHSYDS